MRRVLIALVVVAMLSGSATADSLGILKDIEALWLSAAPDTDPTAVRRAADQGDAKSQYILGMMYDVGLGVPMDHAEAAKWLRKAAEQGDASAQAVLAEFYVHGRGVRLSYTEAVKWYRLAAEQDDVFGQVGLGNLYESGKGVPLDFVLAYMWFNIAAAKGGTSPAESRDGLAKRMTPEQIAEAQRLARKWKPKAGGE